MADKSTFTPAEWSQILGAGMLAGMAISTAAPSGIFGMIKEGMASTGAVLGAAHDPNANPLIKAVVEDFQTSEGRTAAREAIKSVVSGATSPADAETKILAALKSVAGLLDTKAPGDAPAFKAWLQSIGEAAANASAEGGFLGFGGVQVSDAEKAALAEIAKALNPSVA